VGAVNGEHASWRGGAVDLLRNAVVGLAIGVLLAVVALWIRKRLGNPTLETALVLLVPFTAFLAAEQAGAPGIGAGGGRAAAARGDRPRDGRGPGPAAGRPEGDIDLKGRHDGAKGQNACRNDERR
jgi:CPA1 family monovalent cation:H+ antiporter